MKRYLAFLPVVFCLSVLAGVPCSIDPLASYSSSSLPDVTDGLVRWFKFDETSGTVATDTMGVRNNNVYGTPVWETALDGNGLRFTGANYSSGGAAGEYTGYYSYQSDVTWTMWVKLDNVNTFQPIIDTECIEVGGTRGCELVLYVDNTGKLSLWMSGANRLVSTSLVTASTWHFFALAKRGNVFTAYVDNVSFGSASYATLLLGGSLTYGRFADSATRSTGIIDEARVYSRGLTEAELTTVYNKHKP